MPASMPTSSQTLVLIALFAAITAVLGLVPKFDLPFVPVPITAQTLGVMLAGAILGPIRGAAAIALFLALVAAGLPLLAGGRGGLGVLFGPSAGFLLGWPVGAFVVGWLTRRIWPQFRIWKGFLINVLGGIGVIYAAGIPVLSLIAGLPLDKAALAALAFLPGDLIKAALAASVTAYVRRALPDLNR